MKRLIAFLISIVFMVSICGVVSAATADIALDSVKISVNGKIVEETNILYQDRTYAPLRAISESIGCEVGWDGETQTATITGKIRAPQDLVRTYTNYEEEYQDLKDRYDLLIKDQTQKENLEEVARLEEEFEVKVESLKEKYQQMQQNVSNYEYQKADVEFNAITIIVNGQKIDAENILYQGSTYVPIRAVFEAMGCVVEWQEATRTAYISGELVPENNIEEVYTSFEQEYAELKERYDKWIAEQEEAGKLAYENTLKQSTAATGGQVGAQEQLALAAKAPYDKRVEELKQEFEQRVEALKVKYNITE